MEPDQPNVEETEAKHIAHPADMPGGTY